MLNRKTISVFFPNTWLEDYRQRKLEFQNNPLVRARTDAYLKGPEWLRFKKKIGLLPEFEKNEQQNGGSAGKTKRKK